MTSSPHFRAEADGVRITNRSDLIAAIPTILGFVPTDSAVIVGTAAGQLSAVARMDLAQVADLASHLHTYRLLERAHVAEIVIVSGDQPVTEVAAHHPRNQSPGSQHPTADRPAGDGIAYVLNGRVAAHRAALDPAMPYAAQVAQLVRVLTNAGHQVAHAAWLPAITPGKAWRCYHDPGCDGVLPDPRSTVLAAIAAIEGRVTYASRDELVDTLRPDPDVDLERRAELIRVLTLMGNSPDPTVGRGLVDAALDRARAGQLPCSDRELGDLAMSLSIPAVRDASLRHCLGPTSRAAQQLWTTLARAVPAPYRAEPAVLLALTAYLAGDGPLACIAADIARTAAPGHTFAALLLTAIRSGLPPDQLRATIVELFDGI